MKIKLSRRSTIVATRTKKPCEINGLLDDISKINLPQNLYDYGYDLIATIKANIGIYSEQRQREFEEYICTHLLRFAYLLQEREQLVQAPPKAKPKPKKKPETQNKSN